MTILELVGYAGGTSAIVAGVAGFVSNWYLERSLEKMRGTHARELETVKAKLADSLEDLKASRSRDLLVFKAQFDAEFAAYQALWKCVDNSFDAASRIANLYGYAVDDKHGKLQQEAYDQCRRNLNSARSQRPFLDESIYRASLDVLVGCMGETREYLGVIHNQRLTDGSYDHKLAVREMQKRMAQIKESYEAVPVMVRRRIQDMYVVDSDAIETPRTAT
jgi:hypothetical protein